MRSNKKAYLENCKYFSLVKSACEKNGYDDYFVYLITDYLDSLSKLNSFFSVDITKVLSAILFKVKSIVVVDPLVRKSQIDGDTMYVAYSNDAENVNVDFFGLCTDVVVNSSLIDNGLKDASSEYISQMIYGVSKNPMMADQLSGNDYGEKTSNYSNVYSSNPHMSNLLNVVAISSGLSTSEVLAFMIEGNEDKLANKFEKIHGENSYKLLNDNISNIQTKYDNVKYEKIKKINATELISAENNVEILLSDEDVQKIFDIEQKMVSDFFEKFDDDYIYRNSDRLKESLSSQLVRDMFEERLQNVKKPNIRVRTNEGHGFIAIKYIFMTILFILFIASFTYMLIK